MQIRYSLANIWLRFYLNIILVITVTRSISTFKYLFFFFAIFFCPTSLCISLPSFLLYLLQSLPLSFLTVILIPGKLSFLSIYPLVVSGPTPDTINSLTPSSSKEVDAEVLFLETERENFVGKSSSTPFVGSPLCKALECSRGCCQWENKSLTKIRSVAYTV